MLLSSPAHFISHIWKTISTSNHADCLCHGITTTHLNKTGAVWERGGTFPHLYSTAPTTCCSFSPLLLSLSSVSPHPTQSVLIGRTEDGGVRDLARIHPSPFPPPQKKTREPQPGQRFIFFLTTWEMSECRKKYQQLHMGPLLHEWPFFGPEMSPSPPFLHDKFSYALPGPPFPFSPLFSLPLRH